MIILNLEGDVGNAGQQLLAGNLDKSPLKNTMCSYEITRILVGSLNQSRQTSLVCFETIPSHVNKIVAKVKGG